MTPMTAAPRPALTTAAPRPALTMAAPCLAAPAVSVWSGETAATAGHTDASFRPTL